ncbi:MAG TPA: UDP-N-acetylglucosamine 1-carboxyvinyltransferase [Desulfobacterales bacterium]|nr:UDP-N-acetylglucosamine 1-carboxyvinyltransferase [Desulfobacterales bacterium]
MASIVVRGGRPLSGRVTVAGAKNSALKLMAAALLAPGESRIANVPDISDVTTMAKVVTGLGGRVTRDGDAVAVDASDLDSFEAPYELVARMRASIAVLGPLVARFGRARVAMPGGCNIGSRAVDMHIAGLQALGADFSFEHGFIEAKAPDGLRGATVTLEFPSVGATENLLMAAVLARGTTVIENAAREPEIADLAAMLVSMGARVDGGGASTIVIEGVEELRPAEHVVVGDRIEAGTFLVARAITGGRVTVEGSDPAHLEMVLRKLEQAGCEIAVADDGAMTLSRTGPIRPTDIQTLPHPGFPTDMQPQLMALMALAEGGCVITENIFENRFMFAGELVRMGADIRIEGHHALVRGVRALSGAPVRCPDLRAGAALVLAGLAAEGVTEVTGTSHIERGYENFTVKLASLGARIGTDIR